jgi:hypothetical protein
MTVILVAGADRGTGFDSARQLTDLRHGPTVGGPGDPAGTLRHEAGTLPW